MEDGSHRTPQAGFQVNNANVCMLVAGGHANVRAALAFCTAVSLTSNSTNAGVGNDIN